MGDTGALEHRQLVSLGTQRERRVDAREFLRAQPQIARSGIFLDMIGARCLGDCKDTVPARQERECHLTWRGVVGFCDLGKHPAAAAARSGKIVVAERLYAVTATSCFSHQGMTACSMLRSCR